MQAMLSAARDEMLQRIEGHRKREPGLQEFTPSQGSRRRIAGSRWHFGPASPWAQPAIEKWLQQDPELWSDRRAVFFRVKQDGLALKYVAELLRGDRDLVLAAVEENGLALEWVARALALTVK